MTIRRAGFTLIETVATMAVIALVSVGLVTVSNYLLNKRQTENTTDNLNSLRRAVSGNPVIVLNEARTSFGYFGDMGSLPTKLDDLWVKGTQTAFAFDTTKKTGGGWNGPYLDVTTAELASSLGLDGWGNAFTYSTSPFTDTTFGADALGKVQSFGPDLSSGGVDDITIDFFKSELVSRVQGYVKDDNGDAAPGVSVSVNYPQNGTLSSTSVLTDARGYYFASDIPFGNRSVTLDPKLVLVPGTTVVSGGNNEDLAFTVKNFSQSSVTVASISVTYTISPNAWFTQIRVGGTTVFNFPTAPDTNRFGSGSSKSFTGQSVNGTGVVTQAVPIRVQSAITDVEDLVVADVGKGSSLAIQLNNFNSAQTGGGSDVDVTGVSFEVTLKNGSNQTVGVVVVQP